MSAHAHAYGAAGVVRDVTGAVGSPFLRKFVLHGSDSTEMTYGQAQQLAQHMGRVSRPEELAWMLMDPQKSGRWCIKQILLQAMSTQPVIQGVQDVLLPMLSALMGLVPGQQQLIRLQDAALTGALQLVRTYLLRALAATRAAVRV
jgi:hypothetical protein